MWKKTKNAYRVTILINEPDRDDFTIEEDILESEMTPDAMTDFFAYLDWYADDGYEILSAKPIQLTEWKDMRISHRWRNFFQLYGFGEHLSIDYWTVGVVKPANELPCLNEIIETEPSTPSFCNCSCLLCEIGRHCFTSEKSYMPTK